MLVDSVKRAQFRQDAVAQWRGGAKREARQDKRQPATGN
jgi:hypothetical protein